MGFHPSLNLGNPRRHVWFDLGVVREPTFLYLQLEPRRITERISPVMLTTCKDLPGTLMDCPSWPFAK